MKQKEGQESVSALMVEEEPILCCDGKVIPLQSLLQQCQMLFEPSDLFPLDSGYFSVPVHVSKRRDHSQGNFLGTSIVSPVPIFLLPIHVEHRWKFKLIVDLLRSSQCLVKLKS